MGGDVKGFNSSVPGVQQVYITIFNDCSVLFILADYCQTAFSNVTFKQCTCYSSRTAAGRRSLHNSDVPAGDIGRQCYIRGIDPCELISQPGGQCFRVAQCVGNNLYGVLSVFLPCECIVIGARQYKLFSVFCTVHTVKFNHTLFKGGIAAVEEELS